jgi:hypothetical protein
MKTISGSLQAGHNVRKVRPGTHVFPFPGRFTPGGFAHRPYAPITYLEGVIEDRTRCVELALAWAQASKRCTHEQLPKCRSVLWSNLSNKVQCASVALRCGPSSTNI